MKQTVRSILCIVGIVVIWFWVTISLCMSDPRPVSYYTPDYVESYTVGSFDKLQICKVYCLSSVDMPDRIPTEDFQEYGHCFFLLELTKESCDEADIYTAVFREIGPSLQNGW